MRIIDTELPGSVIVELERLADERGFFARTWCAREFAALGIDRPMVQSSLSFNVHAGTTRGLHFQTPPSREGKLVRCLRGEMFDVVVDLRCDSETYLRHLGVNLSGDNYRALYVPPGFAHGFQTLQDDTEVLYMMNDYYDPEASAGVRWNDPAFAVDWPIAEPAAISERDRTYPDFSPSDFTMFRGY